MTSQQKKKLDERSSYYIQVKGIDPDRNIKKLRKLFGVSHTIQKQTMRRLTVTDQEKEELERKRGHHLKELRQQRISSLGANHRYILEIVADLMGTETDEIVTGVVDDQAFVDLLSSMFEQNGSRACMINYAALVGYPPDSGRYVESMKRQTVNRAIVYRSDNVELFGKWVVVYRNNNKRSVDNRTISEDISFFCWKTDKRDTSLVVLKNFIDRILLKSLETVSEFGVAEFEQKRTFFHTLNMFNIFLKSSEATVSSRVNFDVSHELFKGFLLVKFQIEASSRDESRVRLVEKYFSLWMRQIQGILVEGNQIQKDSPDVGPLQMLVIWRRMLARYTSIKEFVSSQAFNNHKACLTLSRSSKLLKVRKKIKQATLIVFKFIIQFSSEMDRN